MRRLKSCVLTQSPCFFFSVLEVFMKRTSAQMTGNGVVLVLTSFQWMNTWNIVSFSRDIIGCTPQFFLSLLVCLCMWVCGWETDANRTWHSPTSTISVKSISSWFCWFFYNGFYVDSHHIEDHQQLLKQLFSMVCFQSTAFYELTLLALFVLLAPIFTFSIKSIKPVCFLASAPLSTHCRRWQAENVGW